MKHRIVIAVLFVVVIASLLAGTKVFQFRTMQSAAAAMAVPPESVASATVLEEDWQHTIPAIASVVAVQGVTVTPEIAGTVREIAFDSGALVEKGDLLVRLDTSAEEAQLRSIEAQANLARINAQRLRQLRLENTVSQSELDTAEATLQQTVASADAVRAAIEKKTVRAPFAGKLGIRLVNLGEYLDTGKAIVSLQSLDPVYVEFALPQQDLARVKAGMPVRVATDTYPDREFEGKLTAINPDLDAATRSVRLQATLANADRLLRPGMFARVEVVLPTRQRVLAIPQTAVLSAPYGDSVFVIEPGAATNAPADLVVRQQFIRTGRARGDFISVTSGLKAGERIVRSGVFKLRNGMAVVENNAMAPKLAEEPRPQNK